MYEAKYHPKIKKDLKKLILGYVIRYEPNIFRKSYWIQEQEKNFQETWREHPLIILKLQGSNSG